MTKATDVPASALRILERVERRIPDLARAAVADPTLRDLPAAIRTKEVPEIARRFYELVVQALRSNDAIDPSQLKLAHERGAQRAEDGMPLSMVLHNWLDAAQLFVKTCTEEAGSESAEGLSYIILEYLRIHEVLICTVTDGYQAERAVIDSEERGAAHLAARLLANGQDASGVTERFGIQLADSYAVLALSMGMLPDEQTGDATGRAVAGRRKLHQVHRALGQPGPFPILALLESEGGQLLFPDSGASTYREAVAATARISGVLRVPVIAVYVDPASRAGLPEACDFARELLELVEVERRPPGVYGIDDVSLEYQLTRPTASIGRLLAVLAPLDPYPDLLGTLETYYQHDLDRGRTSRVLRVHPNTVNNRLNRIMELLEMDPGKVDSVLKLGAALKIRRTGVGT